MGWLDIDKIGYVEKEKDIENNINNKTEDNKYIIVRTDISSLPELVNKLMRGGYKPLGGVSSGSEGWAEQAMIRE
tara:strand:- start:2279 stop:2503 length:225 start_codon:yes stop_codon:yes gene_type:complete